MGYLDKPPLSFGHLVGSAWSGSPALRGQGAGDRHRAEHRNGGSLA
jgi:hypothetical protein